VIFLFNGKIRGAYHFYITGAILDAIGHEKFPRYARLLKAAVDLKNQWYGWDGFIELLNEVANVTSDDDLRAIGVKIMLGLKDGFVSAGYDSTDAIIKDYDPLLKKNTKQMPHMQLPKLIKYQHGYAEIEFNANQPKALIEGYLIGVVQMFENQLIEINFEPIKRDEFTGYKFFLQWQ